MCENADREQDTVADELVDSQKQLDNKVQALTVKQMECDSLALVLAMVPDRHFGSGSGSKPNRCQIGGPGRQ